MDYEAELNAIWDLIEEQAERDAIREQQDRDRLMARAAEQYEHELGEVFDEIPALADPEVREAVEQRLAEFGPVDPSIVPALVEQAAHAAMDFDPPQPARHEPTREEVITERLEAKGENPDDEGARTMEGIMDAGAKPSVFT